MPEHGRPLLAGLVGLGPGGQSLLRALPQAGIELKWLCDDDPQRLTRVGRRQPACARTGDIAHLLGDGELDAVLIAAPAAAQLELTSRVLGAGKHAFLDGPLALSAAALAGLERLGRRGGLAVSCGNTFLHSSPVRAIKEIVDGGGIGELFFVSSSRVDGSGSAWALSGASQRHFAMLLHWLGERPQTVRAVDAEAEGSGRGEVSILNLAFPSGIAANVELDEREGRPMGRTVLVGSERMAVYDEGDEEGVSTLDHGVVHQGDEDAADYRISYRVGNVVPVGRGRLEPLERALEDFSGAVRGERETVANSRLAKNAMRVVEAGAESLRRGGAEVAVVASRRLRRVQSKRWAGAR